MELQDIVTWTVAGGAIGLFGLVMSLQKAIKEISDVVILIRAKFSANGDEELKKEIDEALEAVADVLVKIQMKKQAKILRDVIK